MKKSTILRFLITYICVLLPILVVTMLVTQDLINNKIDDEVGRLESQGVDSANLITRYYSDISVKANILLGNSSFSSQTVLKEPVACMELISLLKTVNSFNEYGGNVVVWYGTGPLITASGTVNPEVYFRQDIRCDQISTSRAQAAINSREKQIVFLSNTVDSGYFLFHEPIGEDGYGCFRSVQIMTTASQLGQMLRTTLRSENVIFQIQLIDQVCYFYNTHEGCKFISEEYANELISEYADLYQGAEIVASGMRFKILCDFEEQFLEIYHLRNISIILLCVGLFVSILISLALSVVRFSNLENLVDQIRRKEPGGNTRKRFVGTEMNYIQTLFNGYINENIDSKKRVTEYRSMLLKHVSMLFLHGSLCNREEIRSAFKTCGIELHEEQFFVLGIAVKDQSALEHLDRLLVGDIRSAITDENGYVMFVLCELSGNDDAKEERRKTADRLLSTLESVDISCLRISISQVYCDLAEGNYAYLESYNIIVNASDFDAKIIAWEDYIQLDGNDEAKIGSTYINDFRSAIATGDAELAIEVLSRAFNQQNIAADEESQKKLRCVYSQLLIDEIKTLDGFGTAERTIHEISNIDVHNQDKFLRSMLRILQEYFAEKDTALAFGHVLQFVDENYTKYNFSLEMVAEFANCSKSKVSKTFRSRIGISYLEYVTQLRMTKAKELLEQTNMSVKEIFSAVGYLDTTNASKKFHAYFGVKPSEYRNKANDF